jgi:biotin carboxylase
VIAQRMVAFVESNTTGTGSVFVDRCRGLDVRPVLLTTDRARYPFVTKSAVDMVLVDTSRIDAIVDACRQLAGAGELAGVTSTSEYFIATAAEAAARLGLPAPNANAIRRCRNKVDQLAILEAAGVAIPAGRGARTARAARDAAHRLGLPVVIKPASGSGSVGVVRCDTLAEVQQRAAVLLRQSTNERGVPQPTEVLVQRFIEDQEYSVELFDGAVIGIARKHSGPLPHFVEVGHDYPAALPAAASRAIRKTAVNAARALSVAWGPAHLEVRLRRGEPVVMEMNARLAGGYIPELVRLASGIDLIAATLARVMGQPIVLRRRARQFASIRFVLTPRDGRLIKLDGAARARAIDGVADVQCYRQSGDLLAVHGDFRDRIGHVIAVADAAPAASAAAERAHARLQVIAVDARPAAAGAC